MVLASRSPSLALVLRTGILLSLSASILKVLQRQASLTASYSGEEERKHLEAAFPVLKQSQIQTVGSEQSKRTDTRATLQKVHENGYREPLAEILQSRNTVLPGPSFEEALEALPVPFRVIEQYKKWHSVDALRRNPDARNRKFAVAFYSCPYSAGNRLHEFFNDLLFSILLNRTLLWKYPSSQEVCHQYNLRCEIFNSLEECDEILARAPWLPSFDEWAKPLGLHGVKAKLLPAVRSFEFQRKQALRQNKHLNASLTSNDFYKGQYSMGVSAVIDDDANDKTAGSVPAYKLVSYGRDFLDLDWASPEDRFKLPNAYARHTASKLYSLGKAFLYGMIHRYSFDFSKNIQNSLPADTRPPRSANSTAGYTIAVHSRHPYDKRLPSCDISRERKCILDILQRQYPTQYGDPNHLLKHRLQPCAVFVLTDRECTLHNLREWIRTSTHCSVEIAPHEKGNGSRGEHGAWGGVGYFQDLAFASAGARHAMVASGGFARELRTSSMTVFELIEYHGKVEAWRSGVRDLDRMGNVSLCILPM